jgi:eukaryotic-like serine/threonine-protein kinase
MGTVFAVYDRRRQREVALKVLNDPEAGSLYRFKREFRAVADLRHPNLVRLYDLGVLPDGEFFFTMELVPGADLKGWVERRRQEARRTIQVGADGTPGSSPRASGSGSAALSATELMAPEATEIGAATSLEAADALEETSTTPELESVLEATGELANVTSTWTPQSEDPESADLAEDVAKVLGDVAEGLTYLHECRLIHRDLKPSNVMVDVAGRARLLDFGILRDLDREGLTLSGAVGTPLYMSPEQVAGEAVGPPADLYSLGCMLYQLLAGRPPFVGRATQVLMRHIREKPEPPSRHRPCDPRLEALCLALLAKEPDARPAVLQVRDTLWEVAGGAPEESSSTRVQPPRQMQELLGRDAELAELQAAFRESREGARVMLVAGESGSGKSALASEFAQRLESQARPWFGGCFEREHVPYKAFDAIVDAAAVELARRGAEGARLLPAGIQALIRMFPVLREVEAVANLAPETPLRDAQAERAVAGRAFVHLLSNLDGGRPPILVVDDLQRSDLESLEVLRWLGLPEAPPCLVIGTFRSEEVDAEHPLRDAMGMPHVQVMPLPPLGEGAVAELAQACARTSLSETKLKRLIEDAQGNPFLAVELARAAERLGEDVLPSVEELVSDRLSGLSQISRRVVEVAAVAGGRAGFLLLAGAAGIPGADLADSVDELLRVQLLREVQGHRGEDAYDLIHDRLRAAIYERVEPGRRRALHLDLAERLAEADDLARAVEHFRLSGEAERAREAALAAAALAEEQLAFDRAAELYRLALPSVDGADSARLPNETERRTLISLAQALAKAGRHADAAEVFERSARGAPEHEARELLLEAATRRITTGDIQGGMDVFEGLLGKVGHKLKIPFAFTLVAIVWRFVFLIWGWWLRDLMPTLFGRCPIQEPDAEEDYRLRLFDRVHMALAVSRPVEAARFGLMYAVRSRRYGQGRYQGRARIGYSLFLVGDLGTLAASRANHHLDIGEALCHEANDAQGLLAAAVSRNFLALLASNWEQIRQVSRDAELLARKAGLHGEPALLLIETMHLGAEMFGGNPDATIRVAQRYVEAARARGNNAGLAWPLSMQGYVYLWQGRREEAARALSEALEITPRDPITVLGVHVELQALALHLFDGTYAEGLTKLEDLNHRWRCGGLLASSLENASYRLTKARLRLGAALEAGNVTNCRIQEGLGWLLPAPTSIRVEVLRLEAAIAYHQGNLGRAHRLLSRSLRMAEQHHNKLSAGLAHYARAVVRRGLERPGAGLDEERAASLLEHVGCQDCYVLRVEGWSLPAAKSSSS